MPFVREILAQLSRSDVENNIFLTLSEAEIKKYNEVAQEVIQKLQQTSCALIRVAKVVKSGSVDKKTALPGYSDVDFVIQLASYDPSKRSDYAIVIKDNLKTLSGMIILPCADDIILTIYKEIFVDITITGDDPNALDNRAARYYQAGKEIADILECIGSDNFVREVICGCKYVIKRIPAVSLKSCLIEQVVLQQFKANREIFSSGASSAAGLSNSLTLADKRKKLFKLFFQFFANDDLQNSRGTSQNIDYRD